MSDDISGGIGGDADFEDLGGPSPKGHQAGPTGTGEFLEAKAEIYHESGEISTARLELSSHRFRRAPERALIQALNESEEDLEDAQRIEVQVGGEKLTLKQTGWEIQ